MKRPAFQFYPGDWLRNANLRRCSHAARGAWMDVLCVLHDSDEYGLIRWPLEDLANACAAPIKLLRELVAKGVLKGCDKGACDPFIYTPRSGRKDGEPVTLVRAQEGPIWYSSRMVKDEHVRTIRGESSRFDESPDAAPKRTPKPAPKPPFGDGSSSASATAVGSGSTNVDPLPRDGVTPYAAVCIALKAAGVANVNPAHPTLRALVDAGADVLEFVGAVKASEGKADRFAYVIGTVEGQRKRAAETAGVIHHGPLKVISKQAALEERNRSVAQAWAKGQA